jgi:hypothetical protein
MLQARSDDVESMSKILSAIGLTFILRLLVSSGSPGNRKQKHSAGIPFQCITNSNLTYTKLQFCPNYEDALSKYKGRESTKHQQHAQLKHKTCEKAQMRLGRSTLDGMKATHLCIVLVTLVQEMLLMLPTCTSAWPSTCCLRFVRLLNFQNSFAAIGEVFVFVCLFVCEYIHTCLCIHIHTSSLELSEQLCIDR